MTCSWEAATTIATKKKRKKKKLGVKQFSVKEVWNIYTKILLVVVLHKNAHAHSLRGSCFLKNEKKKKKIVKNTMFTFI